MRPKRVIRPKEGMSRLACGHTKFYQDYVYHAGGSEYVAGTKVRRLRLGRPSPHCAIIFEDEFEELIEALRAERDALIDEPVAERDAKAN